MGKVGVGRAIRQSQTSFSRVGGCWWPPIHSVIWDQGTMPPPDIRTIGKYNVIEIVGRGGMGVVFKATDPSLGRLVAIKMMSGAFAGNADLLKRFYSEAQATGSLNHPNIVTVYEMDDHGGVPYIVMQFLEGKSLQNLLNERRAGPLHQRINYVVQICRGLEYAHSRQVIHRDIKPANIVVLKDGSLKIVDFGIARIGDMHLTRPGQVIGTVDYMSPEQLNDGKVDQRADIYATGMVLFQLLTYELPFHCQELAPTVAKILHDAPPPLSKYLVSYPQELDSIIAKSLAKDKEERYASAEDLALDLQQIERDLKRQSTQEMLQRSMDFMAREQWNEGREQLQELLRLDPYDVEANRCMREVQQRAQMQHRSQQARDLRAKAEGLAAQGQFALALKLLEEASSLDGSPDLVELRDKVKQLEEEKTEKTARAMQEAQSARAVDDLDHAIEAAKGVLLLQPDHKEALALHDALANEIAVRVKRSELRQLSESAHRYLSERRFSDALEVLKRVEDLDANYPTLHQLQRIASEGLNQERRRRELEAAIGATDIADQNHIAPESGPGLPSEEQKTLGRPSGFRTVSPTESPHVDIDYRPPPEQEASASEKTLRANALSTSSVRWLPENALVQIERRLAVYLGPMAKVIVRRAAAKVRDVDNLLLLAAESLDTDLERKAFLACKETLDIKAAKPNQSESTVVKGATGEPHTLLTGSLSPEQISKATRLLARYLGPLATVLVRKAAQRADSVRALYLLLADELDSEAERAQFLREAGVLGQR